MLECFDAHVISRDWGVAIFIEGSHATRFGVVLSGLLVVVKDGMDGKRYIVKRIGEKAFVAAAQDFQERRRCASASKRTPSAVF